MFDKLKDMAALMGQAKQMRQKMELLQVELARKTVDAEAGAGAVRVTMNGKLQVLSVKLDRAVLSAMTGVKAREQDHRLIEDLIASAINDASRKAQELIQAETSKLMGDLNLPPGLDKMLAG